MLSPARPGAIWGWGTWLGLRGWMGMVHDYARRWRTGKCIMSLVEGTMNGKMHGYEMLDRCSKCRTASQTTKFWDA